MKTKVLSLVQGEYLSHTIKALEISKELRATGKYDITFSGTGEYMQLAENTGFKCIRTPTLSKLLIGGTLEKQLSPKIFTRENVKYYFDIEDKLIQDQKPNIILRDHFREMAGVAAKKQGVFDVNIQLASCSPFYFIDFRISQSPRMLEHFIPKILLQKVGKQIHKSQIKKIYQPIKELIQEIGLPEKEGFGGLEADLILLADEPDFFPLKRLRDNYKFIGIPFNFDNYKAPIWIEGFAKDPRKKVVITCGSSGLNDKNNLFVNTFKDKNLAIAINTSSGISSNGFYGGDNFDVSKVAPYADALITHGGIGSTYLGLKNGVPILSIPNHFEQEINSNRLERIGAGIFLYPDRVSPKNINKNIERLLNNSSFKRNAEAFSKKMIKNPAKLAVRYIEEGYQKFKNN